MTTRLDKVIGLIDDANRQDPYLETWDGRSYPKELLYSQRMTAWLERLVERPSEAQRIAARGQHVRRWTVPREAYPKTRAGYRAWRSGLYTYHAETVGALMAHAGYDGETIDKVKNMVGKRGLKTDPDVQLIEDVACLVFIEYYFLDFAKGYDEDKLVAIARKTWNKMSPRAQEAALALDLPEAARAILGKAVG